MTIGQFLIRLACDERLLRRFSEGPEGAEAAMREAGLEERHIEFLLRADLSDLRLKVEAEFAVDDEKMAIITIFGIPTIFAPPPPPPDAS